MAAASGHRHGKMNKHLFAWTEPELGDLAEVATETLVETRAEQEEEHVDEEVENIEEVEEEDGEEEDEEIKQWDDEP